MRRRGDHLTALQYGLLWWAVMWTAISLAAAAVLACVAPGHRYPWRMLSGLSLAWLAGFGCVAVVVATMRERKLRQLGRR
jgi:hypothetical protein